MQLNLSIINTFITRARAARLPTFFFHFLNYTLGVKVRSISCNIARAISRNMDRSRMSGIGKLHDDGHVPCNYVLYY